MKVLFINTVCGRSSTGGIVRDIGDLLKENGDQYLCLYGRYSAPDYVSSLKIENIIGFYSHILITRLFDRQGFGSRKATQKAISAIEDFEPDIIHLHNLHGSYINIRLLFDYLKSRNIPIVWTIHDCWAFTGHCTHFLYNDCYKWKDGTCDKCPRKTAYPASYALDQSKRNITEKKSIFLGLNKMIITGVSDWLCERINESFLHEYTIRRIYNGVNTDVFRPLSSDIREKIGVGSSEKMILCVTDGWSKRKGLDYIYQLNSAISSKSLPYRIVMVGVQKRLKRKIPEGIVALQRTDSVDQLVKLYSAADVFWNPSEVETFGLVNIEALACGTPVITMNSTACPETVDATCGICISPTENVEEQVIEAIKILTLNKKLYSEACIKKAEFFSKTNSYNEYIKLYNELMNE